MGKVKQDIKDLVKEAGSKSKALSAARDWYDRGSKSMRDNTIAKNKDPFKPGMIYVFRYDKPKNIKTLPWWDKNPVVLALDTTDAGNDCGINLNLLPVDVKEDMLDLIYEKLKSMIKSQSSGVRANNANLQGEIKLDYKNAKKFLDKYGLGFAIRQYIPELKVNQKVVSYENWGKIALVDFLELEGLTVNELKKQYSDYLKNYLKNKDI